MAKDWAKDFYESQVWKDTRAAFLQHKEHACERCSTDDVPVLAVIAHHKIYLTPVNINDPHISLSWDNLEALCQDCHNKEHHRRKQRVQRYVFDAKGNLSPPVSERV